MYYYKARMFSPALGRFMQSDPIGYGDGMNMYAYVGNDPVNNTDPSGTDCAGISNATCTGSDGDSGYPPIVVTGQLGHLLEYGSCFGSQCDALRNDPMYNPQQNFGPGTEAPAGQQGKDQPQDARRQSQTSKICICALNHIGDDPVQILLDAGIGAVVGDEWEARQVPFWVGCLIPGQQLAPE